MRRVIAVATAFLCWTAFGSEAHALFPERYIVCDDDDRPQLSPTVASIATELEELPKRRAPPKLEVAPLFVADVATPSPIPAGHKEVELIALVPPPVLESRNDYRCIGLVRGAPGIQRVVGSAPGARFLRHPYPSSWIEANVDAAGAFALKENIPALDKMLNRAIPERVEAYVKLERLRLKVAAARALADLGYAKVTPELLTFVRERESTDFPAFWEDSLEALARLDPAVAHDYAVEALGRIGATPEHDTREGNHVRELLPLLKKRDSAALAALMKVHAEVDPKLTGSGGYESCLIFAARIRVGDDALRDELRKELADLRTNRSSVCYAETVAAAFPGEDPVEVDTLLFRHRYVELLRLVEAMGTAERAGKVDARFEPARNKIMAWLIKRGSDPDVKKDETDRRYNPVDRARHLAIGAGLGDEAALGSLYALIDDPEDDGVAPWIAAAAALDLDLPKAADHAVKRLLIARTQHTERFSTEPWPTRGRVTVTEHVEVIDRLAARGDMRFALGLLDRNVFAREATVHWVSQLRPREACSVVAANAVAAEEKSIQDAFWALSVLGTACQSAFERVWKDKSSPPARGMALEALAMLRVQSIAADVEPTGQKKDDIRPARERARIILLSPE